MLTSVMMLGTQTGLVHHENYINVYFLNAAILFFGYIDLSFQEKRKWIFTTYIWLSYLFPNNNVKTSLLNVIASIAYFTFISEWMAIHDTRLSGSLLASLRNWTSRTKLANKTVFIVTWLIKIISLLSLSLYLCLSL